MANIQPFVLYRFAMNIIGNIIGVLILWVILVVLIMAAIAVIKVLWIAAQFLTSLIVGGFFFLLIGFIVVKMFKLIF